MKISVILCSHNPNVLFLEEVISSLKSQTLSYDQWEIILIDNLSNIKISSYIDLSWHPDQRIVIEPNLGLIHARIRGVRESKYEILATVDDDTPLFPDYLSNLQSIYLHDKSLGIVGGKTIPIFKDTQPTWQSHFFSSLAIRDLGDSVITEKISPNQKIDHYPVCAALLIAPKRECMQAFIAYYEQNSLSKTLGRKGESLASGEDNDINLFIYKNGWKVGYFPELKFNHIIPGKRMTKQYLAKLEFSMNRSWIKVLNMHNILPWKKISKISVYPRMVLSYFRNKAWKSDLNYVKWSGSCGMFKGLSEIE